MLRLTLHSGSVYSMLSVFSELLAENFKLKQSLDSYNSVIEEVSVCKPGTVDSFEYYKVLHSKPILSQDTVEPVFKTT